MAEHPWTEIYNIHSLDAGSNTRTFFLFPRAVHLTLFQHAIAPSHQETLNSVGKKGKLLTLS